MLVVVVVVVVVVNVFAAVEYILTHLFDCNVLVVFYSNSDSGAKCSQYRFVVVCGVVVVVCGMVIAWIRCIDCVILRVYVTRGGGGGGGGDDS